ncbi:MAG: ECF-type sigma factor, partial [Planctomycetota bacterium]
MEEDLTPLIRDSIAGKKDVLDLLFDRVGSTLLKLAAQRLAGERPDHTLEPADLVHEAYLRLLNQ